MVVRMDGKVEKVKGYRRNVRRERGEEKGRGGEK
jgi:hypothetical protein